MKYAVDLTVNEGFCASDPVAVELEFADGSTATFFMSAMSQKIALELLDAGIDLDKLGDEKDIHKLLEASREIFKKFLHGWEWTHKNGREIPFNDDNFAEVTGDGEFGKRLLEIAKDLGIKAVEVEEKNSENSSDGPSDLTTSP